MTKMRATESFREIYNAIVIERLNNAKDEQRHGYRYRNNCDSN